MKYFSVLVIILFLFVPVLYAQDCTMEPIENTQYGAAVTNEAGNVVYIVDNDGEVNVTVGQAAEDEEVDAEEEIAPQVAYGVSSDTWWTGVAILNPSTETKTGVLKIGSQYYNLTVPSGAPLTFNLGDWVAGNNTQYTISLYSNDLYLEVIRGQK